MEITGIDVCLVDIPFRVVPKFGYGERPVQNFAIVQVQTDERVEGLGEASCCGGPTRNEESAESVKMVIERCLTPVLLGQDPVSVERILERMDMVAKRNYCHSGQRRCS